MSDDRAVLYTSRSLLEIERRFLDKLATPAEHPVGVLDAVIECDRLRVPDRRPEPRTA